MSDEIIYDKRIGCVAVYRGHKLNCLSGINKSPDLIYYRQGYYDTSIGWTIKSIYLFVGRILWILNIVKNIPKQEGSDE